HGVLCLVLAEPAALRGLSQTRHRDLSGRTEWHDGSYLQDGFRVTSQFDGRPELRRSDEGTTSGLVYPGHRRANRRLAGAPGVHEFVRIGPAHAGVEQAFHLDVHALIEHV